MNVKLFTKYDNAYLLEDDLNEFIKNKNIIDIKYSTSFNSDEFEEYYSAMVIYGKLESI